MSGLVQKFRNLPASEFGLLKESEKPIDLVLGALAVAVRQGYLGHLKYTDIEDLLCAAGLPLNVDTIAKALARAGKRVVRQRGTGNSGVRLSASAQADVARLLRGRGLSVVHIESGKPRQTVRQLAEILGSMRGTIRVVDPYFGMRTLDSFDLLPRDAEIRFLTSHTNERLEGVRRRFQEYATERGKADFRLVPSGMLIHDRYMITDNELVIMGHGLKDIGNKHSFVIRLPRELVGDVLDSQTRRFDGYWAQATSL